MGQVSNIGADFLADNPNGEISFSLVVRHPQLDGTLQLSDAEAEDVADNLLASDYVQRILLEDPNSSNARVSAVKVTEQREL